MRLRIKNLCSLVHFFGAGGSHHHKLSSEFGEPMASRDIFMLVYFLDLRVGYECSFCCFVSRIESNKQLFKFNSFVTSVAIGKSIKQCVGVF